MDYQKLIDYRDTDFARKGIPIFYIGHSNRSVFFHKKVSRRKNMENFTALGANEITKNITFQGEMHKKFFLLYLPECRNEDVYHQAYGTDKTGNQQGTSRCYQLCGGVRAVRFVYCLRSRLHQKDK